MRFASERESGKRAESSSHRIVLATELLTDDEGTSAVEFALIAPVLVLLLLGTVDMGKAIYDIFVLNAAVSAAEQYAILNASVVSSVDGPAACVIRSQASRSANSINAVSINAAINVNNGSTATVTAGAVATTGGSASPADKLLLPELRRRAAR